MKFSSWLAASAIIGRELCKGPRNWKDAFLWSIIAKNELLDKEGEVRKMIEQGSTDRETEELRATLENELAKQQATKHREMIESNDDLGMICTEDECNDDLGMIYVEKPKPSRLGSFLNGFKKGWRGE